MPKAILANGTATQQVSRQTDTQKIAAIYARVSTTEQADKGYSLPTQLDACQAMARQEGYAVPDTHVFVDDYTGTSLNRPQFTPLRDLVRQRLVQAVFVYDLDRLSRKLAHQLLLSEEFEQAGVVLRIVTMPDGAKTPEAQLLSNVRGIIAEYERAKILERTARGRRGRAQAGHVTYGRRTLGYTYVKHPSPDKGAHYEVHPDEAALVQRIFRLYVEGGRSMYAIAALLTAEGIPTPHDRKHMLTARVWHPATIANMLHNTAYIGTLYDGKTQRLPGKSNPDKKTRHRRVPKEEWTPIAVPPIIDPATFEAARAQLQRNKSQSKRNRKHEYLFVGGRLRCGQCGRAMAGVTNGAGYRDYRCNRLSFQNIMAPHSRRSVQATAIEPVVWDAVERVLNNPALIAAELEKRREGTSAQQADLDYERSQYNRQLAQCDKELKKWEDAYIGEVIDLAGFKAKKAEVDARRASVEQELARLDDQQRLIEQAELETASLIEYCARVRQELQHFTLEEKRRALEALNITVIWHPEKPPEIHGSLPVAIVSNAFFLNLYTEKGRQIARQLADRVDVLVENFRPGTLEKWGLGPQELKQTNPGLIYARISGYGQTGPYASRPGFASVCEGIGGFRYINGFPGEPPVRPNLSLGDTLAGLHAVLGILLAYIQRQKPAQGHGQVVDVAIYEVVFNMLEAVVPEYAGAGVVRQPSGSTLTGIVPTNTYRCRDGTYVIIGGNGDSIFQRLMRTAGRSDMATDPPLADNAGRVAHEQEIDAAISAWTASLDAAEMLQRLEVVSVPAGPIYSVADMVRDPHFHARGLFHEVEVDGKPLKIPALMPQLSATPGGTDWPGPAVGAHNHNILGGMLGLSEAELEALQRDGII